MLHMRWHEGLAIHRPLMWLGAASIVGAAFTVLLMAVDVRVVSGAPVWHKPFKFFVSSMLYAWTLTWYVSRLFGARRRVAWWAGTVTAVALGIELTLIAMQAWRGVGSHFNVATSFDAAVFSAMGLFILTLSAMLAVVWVVLLQERGGRAVWRTAARWGAAVTLLGLGVGGLMVRPTSSQIAEWRQGARPVLSGGHAVGVPDGGPGLPLLNWSTQGGDLRVAHFAGLHALQGLPLLAWALTRPRRWPDAVVQRVVAVVGVGYTAFVLVVLQQARRAQPVLPPDTSTLLWLGLIVAFCAPALLALLLVRTPRRAAPR